MEINVYAAKSQLSQLIRRAADGEDVVITRNGEPVARLVPVGAPAPRRQLGMLAGRVRVSDDFDGPLPDDVLERFEGKT